MGIFITVVIVVVVFGVIVALMQSAAQKDTQQANQSAIATVRDFTPAVSHAGVSHSAGVSIDAARQKFMIARGNHAPLVYDFGNLIAVEVFRNSNSVSKTNRGSQAVGAAAGALLLGPAGMLLGGLSGSTRTENKITRLSLKIFTNDLMNPASEIVFFDAGGGKGHDANSILLKAPMQELDNWYGRFQTILHMQASLPPTEMIVPPKKKSIFDADSTYRFKDI